MCPFWAGSPYELLVIPRTHEAHLQDSAPADLAAVGRAVRDALEQLRRLLGDVSYNLVFHTAPHRHNGPFHWHAHIWPKLVSIAGFERGTGVLINIVPPGVLGPGAPQGRRHAGLVRRVTRVYVSTLIDAAPSEVWQAVEPIERHVEWMTDADGDPVRGRRSGAASAPGSSATPRSGRCGSPTTWRSPSGTRARTMGVRHAGLVTGTGRFTLEPAVQGGTLFAWEEDLRFPWYLGGPVAGAVGGGQVMRRIWRHNLATLKHLIESGR